MSDINIPFRNRHRRGRRVLVGVTGGIAAYKSPELVRRLKERGCEVRVVMSEAAKAFITPLTLQAVSGHPVHEHLLDADAESGMGHIELARWAELIVVAPATANFIAKLAAGQADDLLSTLVVATSAEIAVAPAMNQQMWQHSATRENLQRIVQRGVHVIGPGSGDQACGEIGPGRMTNPDEIAALVADPGSQPFAGRRVLLTAGPTFEAIDPVRGITNHSSGKMGYALAAAAADLGASVTLVSGPVHLTTPPDVERVNVQSAREMLAAVMERAGEADLFVAVAAVADYRPACVSEQKIKKADQQETMTMKLVRNPDILASVGAMASPPFTVGFAAETENLIANARAKLVKKNLQAIVANNVGTATPVFGSDQTTVVLLTADDQIEIPSADKYTVSLSLLERLHDLMQNQSLHDDKSHR